MSIIPLKIKLEEQKPLDLSIRQWRTVTKSTFAAVGEWWHSTIMPRHFEPGAESRYFYKRRSRVYLRRKARLAAAGQVEEGGKAALVFRGDARRALTQFATISAYPTRFTVRMIGPKYFTMTRRDPRLPNLAAETTRLARDEFHEMSGMVRSGLAERVAALRVNRTTQLG